MNIKKWYQKLINRDDYPEVKEGQAGSDLDRYKNGVSVITPSYKGKKYILKLLESMPSPGKSSTAWRNATTPWMKTMSTWPTLGLSMKPGIWTTYLSPFFPK